MRRIELIGKKGFLTKAQETRRLTRLPVNLQASPRGSPCLQWIQHSNTRFARNLALSRIWWQIFMEEEIPPAEFSKIHVQRRSHFASGCRSWGKSLSPGSLVIIDRLLSLHGASLLSCFCCSVAKLWLTLQPQGLKHTRLLCPSLSPGVCSNPCPLSQDAIQPSHPLSPPSPPVFNLSQHQGHFQWIGSSHQVPKVLDLQLHFLEFSLNYPPCLKLLTAMLCLKQPWPYWAHA